MSTRRAPAIATFIAAAAIIFVAVQTPGWLAGWRDAALAVPCCSLFWLWCVDSGDAPVAEYAYGELTDPPARATGPRSGTGRR